MEGPGVLEQGRLLQSVPTSATKNYLNSALTVEHAKPEY